MPTNMEAFIPRFPHPIQQCVDRADLGRLQEIKLNTQKMIQDGLDKKTWENYLKRAEAAEKLVIEEFLRTSLFVGNIQDN